VAIESNNISEPSFREKHSVALRIWHWATYFLITGSLVTVLFAKTLFNAKTNTQLVQGNLQKSNVPVTATQARSVAHEFSDLIWGWHIYIGYVLAGFLGFRILFELFQPKNQKVIPAIKNSLAYLRQTNANAKQGKHYLLVRIIYLFFYLALLVQAITGLFMAYSDDVPNLKNLRHTASDIHSVFMWVIITYIVIHLGGVLLAELGKKYKGVISDMINGGE